VVEIGNARESRKAEEQGAPGYSNNAESEFSRRAASGGKAEVGPSLRERQSWGQVDLLIRRHMNELAKLESKIVTEPDPARAAKLAKQQEIKLRFIERLRAEQIENAVVLS
jgi:hypothetical protein